MWAVSTSSRNVGQRSCMITLEMSSLKWLSAFLKLRIREGTNPSKDRAIMIRPCIIRLDNNFESTITFAAVGQASNCFNFAFGGGTFSDMHESLISNVPTYP